MGRRRLARELALQALYIIDTSSTPQAEAIAIVNRRHPIDDQKSLDFALELVAGVNELKKEIDGHIKDAAANWTVARMAAVDRNVLRLAAYELIKRADIPINVIIDEAIEIARKFSTEDSSRFINGVLDKMKGLRHGPQERSR